MLEALQNAAEAILSNVLVNIISAALSPVEEALQYLATAGAIRDLTTLPWARNLILGTQGIAAGVLTLRLCWEALQMATIRADGGQSDPALLIKRTVMAAIGITSFPLIARELIVFGNLLASGVASAGWGIDLESLDLSSLLISSISTIPITIILFAGPGLILLLLIFFQALIRTVEITLAAIISPVAALGYMSGGGMADVWWREVMVLSCSQAVQMLLLYMATTLLSGPRIWGSVQATLGPFLFVAALWVAWKTPAVLRNYAYSTGISSAAGNVGQAFLYRMMMKKI